ncbi:MAG: DUF1611 domain-containing protein [Acidiferrobacterales bacterium]|nr:DUF1611 domain-containing protein [Acidiferrobacterales bacterium]
MKLEKPYLLFVGNAHDELAAKTAIGVLDWCPEDCIGQFRLPDCVPDLNLPSLTMKQAAEQGARTVLIGVAVRGGEIPDSWTPHLVEALANDMSIANGLHTTLDSIPEVRKAAEFSRGELHEIRKPSGNLRVASGSRRSGRRLLTVGTDCSVGKMYTSLAIAREMQARHIDADFRATGQTGIFIEGSGVPVDAVVADFISGSVEDLCPAADDDHWDLIEGQGSLHHPSFAGVSLGLLHGAQPDSLILCHEPTRSHMRGLPDRPLPSLEDAMAINLENGRTVQQDLRFAGISVNTKYLDESESQRYLAGLMDLHQLPCVDPFRTGVGTIVDNLV